MNFRDFLNEAKVRNETLPKLDYKKFGLYVPICRGIDKTMDRVCDLVESGYYVLFPDSLISPEDLGKVPEAKKILGGERMYFQKTYMSLRASSSIENKIKIIHIENGEKIYNIKPNKGNRDFINANILLGETIRRLTRPKCEELADADDMIDIWLDKNNNIAMIGPKNAVNPKKANVFWSHNMPKSTFTSYKPGELRYKKISIKELYPQSNTQNDMGKDFVFKIKGK